MTTIKASTTPTPPPTQSTPHWLTAEWLEPRLVGVTGVGLALSLLGEQLGMSSTLILAINIVIYISGGLFGAKNALESLFQERKLDIDMLMVLAALGAASIGQWHEGALLLFLFSLSNVLQDYAIGRSRQAIQSLFKLYPETAQVRRDGQVLTLKLAEILIGDVILVQPGERIAVDGVVISGRSSIDESPITGESMPVDKTTGDKVFAGTLNKQGILDVRATKSASQTTLARIIQLVEEAQETKAPTERFLDKFEQVYATFIILGTLAFILLVPPVFGVDFDSAFYRAMVLMTVASPCALVISVPSAYISAIASSARMGVLLKGGAYLEHLANVKAIAFDKTGTLTIGEPRVTDVLPYQTDENTLLTIASAVEARSEHPLARAIVLEAQNRQLASTEIQDFHALAGRGVEATLNNKPVVIGSLDFLAQSHALPETLASAQDAFATQGKTTMGVLYDGTWLGIIAMADQMRPQSKAVVAELQQMGVTVAMLTGDNERVARHIAGQVGITNVHASLLPEDKVTVIQEMVTRYQAVAMVGDGVNDAPALATATVGLAMGGAGTDVAMETADVVLMGDNIERIAGAIRLAKQAKRVVWQNIAFSIGVIILLILGAFLIDLPLPLGVLGHEGSTVIVVINGLVQLLLLPEMARRRAVARA